MEQSTLTLGKLHYFNSSDFYTPYELSKALTKLLTNQMLVGQIPVFLCIGSDRATGDSLGPIIGYKLTKLRNPNLYVYGTLEHPVHAINLEDTLRTIKKEHPNAFIIAIDASLGKRNHIGYITLGSGSLKPGAGVSKELPTVGDLNITGIVNMSGFMDYMLLQSTRLNIVMNLADSIYLGIRYCLNSFPYRSC